MEGYWVSAGISNLTDAVIEPSLFFFTWQLSANLRHIRVFEMDVEDEDDEGAESQNAIVDQDGLETAMTGPGPVEESLESEGGSREQEGDMFQKSEELLQSQEAL